MARNRGLNVFVWPQYVDDSMRLRSANVAAGVCAGRHVRESGGGYEVVFGVRR